MITPQEFLSIVKNANPKESITRLGTITAGYVSGRPQVQFDGESSASTQTYPYLSSYTPAADDRVVLLRVGPSWLILGKVV